MVYAEKRRPLIRAATDRERLNPYADSQLQASSDFENRQRVDEQMEAAKRQKELAARRAQTEAQDKSKADRLLRAMKSTPHKNTPADVNELHHSIVARDTAIERAIRKQHNDKQVALETLIEEINSGNFGVNIQFDAESRTLQTETQNGFMNKIRQMIKGKEREKKLTELKRIVSDIKNTEAALQKRTAA